MECHFLSSFYNVCFKTHICKLHHGASLLWVAVFRGEVVSSVQLLQYQSKVFTQFLVRPQGNGASFRKELRKRRNYTLLLIDFFLLCLHPFLKLGSWPRTIQAKFNFTIYPITFPKDNEREWKKLFKPCASQRLFLPVCYTLHTFKCSITVTPSQNMAHHFCSLFLF